MAVLASNNFTWTSSVASYPATSSVPFPPRQDVVEFGKAFAVSKVMTADELAIKAAYDMALSDFLREKKVYFPNWDGLPEIKVNNGGDPLRRVLEIGWYAAVPIKLVINPEDIADEELWNS